MTDSLKRDATHGESTPRTDALEKRLLEATKLFLEMPHSARINALPEFIGDISYELLTECRQIELQDVPLCDGHADSWFTGRNHLKSDTCVACAFAVSEIADPLSPANIIAASVPSATRLNGWVPVGTSDVPAEGHHVIVFSERDECKYTAYTRDGKWYHACGDGHERYRIMNVTKWMEIP